MTARAARLAGAILLESAGEYFLIGNTKEPCDWPRAGFDPPVEIDAVRQPFLRLVPCGEIAIVPPFLSIHFSDATTETLAQIVADRFLIRRNGSVSERLWRIITGESDESGTAAAQSIEAGWLVAMPDRIWQIVRDAALKCL